MRGDVGLPVRIRYEKRGRIRFLGHRDMARAFERAFRMVALPLAFSEGFSPHPKVSFGLALPVGCESDGEYLDLLLRESIDLEGLDSMLSVVLPEGIDVTGVVPIADRAPSLQESVTAVEWRVTVSGDSGAPREPDDVTRFVESALAEPELLTTRRRKGREVREDVKPAIRRIDVRGEAHDEPGRVIVEMECATHPRSPKPGDVLDALAEALAGEPMLVAQHVLRTHQWIERDGARHEPLDADPRPHVPEARAS